jgi:hypothetical protein
MAFRNMTGTTCSSGEILTFVASDNGVSVNDFFQLGDGRCLQINSINTATTENAVTVNLAIEFASCAACLAPYSANTQQSIPIYLNSSINNGSATASTYNPPNPVWLDNQHHAVVQLNAVTIGGNGLNS